MRKVTLPFIAPLCLPMEQKKQETQGPSEEEKKVNVVYFGYFAGIPFVLYSTERLPAQINLGQKWEDKRTNVKTDKYKVRTNDGRPTGKGYAFEDVFAKKMRQLGFDVKQVREIKNGADFLINGTPVQCKYAASPLSVFNSLFKEGKFRYPNQIIVTNKENEEGLRKLCNENPELFGGNIPVINPPEYTECYSKEVQEQYTRGWVSVKNDTISFFQNTRSRNTLFGGMVAVFLTAIGIGTAIEYKNVKKNNPEDSRLKCLGNAVVSSTKKHWGKALVSSFTMGALILGSNLIKCQRLRPV